MRSRRRLRANGTCGSLPSSSAAVSLLRGEPGGLTKVVLSTAARAVLVGIGLYCAGERARLVRYSVAGAMAIEAFVLIWIGRSLDA